MVHIFGDWVSSSGAWFGSFLRLALPSHLCRYLVTVSLAGHSIFSSLPEFPQVFFLLYFEPFASSEYTSLLLDSARLFLSSILFGDESRSWRRMGLTYVHLLWNYYRRIRLMVAIDTSRFGRSWRSCGGNLPALGWFFPFVLLSEGDKPLTIFF